MPKPNDPSPGYLSLTTILNQQKYRQMLVTAPASGQDDYPMAEPDPDGEEYPTNSAAYIMQTLVSEWRQQFLEKNAAYGEDKDPLGSSAEFVEIWRKARKLRRALWESEDIGEEDVREVAMDMIGHLFLLIHILDSDQRLIEVVPDSDPEAWVDPDGGDPRDVGRTYPGRYA